VTKKDGKETSEESLYYMFSLFFIIFSKLVFGCGEDCVMNQERERILWRGGDLDEVKRSAL